MKMTNPFSDIENAFRPFFNEAVVARLKTGEAQTIPACVFDDIEGEPLLDQSLDTERRDIVVLCRAEDWLFVKKLRRGDRIEMPDAGLKYAVSQVRNDADQGIVIKARQI